AKLKTTDAEAFNTMLDSVLHVVDSLYEAAPGKFFLPAELKEAYSTIGGARHLDGEYTVFGEIIEGLDIIDKIAVLPVDGNNRPKSDAKIVRMYAEE
ncbi:MAG: peptidylprolyl isomerase, partial [Petrimonas sp.]|nr:peptidylprolyl isomerase [Petrimonas sp.]